MKKKLYLVAGANGSGKTTLAHELLRDEKGLTFLNVDETAAKIGDRVGLASGRVVLTEINRMLVSGESFAMESTVSGKYHLRILGEAKSRGYETILIYVFLDSVDLNIARIKNRVLLGGHDVPEADVIRRYDRSLKSFRNITKIVDFWELYYNGINGYEQIAVGGGDMVCIFNDERYEQFQEVLGQ